MRKLNGNAWKILLETEKTALNLQHVAEKSSWQAGEIMKRSHYKYLEIKYRAEHFLKLFTQYFNIHETIIPAPVIERTQDKYKAVLYYFDKCIGNRAKPFEVLEAWNEEAGQKLTKNDLNTLIEDLLNEWAESEDLFEIAIFNLVKEFDRWNNFRILPKTSQEPSAYKRRLKNVQKRRVRLACSLNGLALEKIESAFGAKKKPLYYLPIVVESRLHLLKVKAKDSIAEILSDFNLYLFTEEAQAKEYGELILMYMTKQKRECQDGLVFWPRYRDLVKVSVNYERIDNITPTRRYLQLAISKHEFY